MNNKDLVNKHFFNLDDNLDSKHFSDIELKLYIENPSLYPEIEKHISRCDSCLDKVLDFKSKSDNKIPILSFNNSLYTAFKYSVASFVVIGLFYFNGSYNDSLNVNFDNYNIVSEKEFENYFEKVLNSTNDSKSMNTLFDLDVSYFDEIS